MAATPPGSQIAGWGVGGKMGREVNILNKNCYFLRSPSFKLFGQGKGNSICVIFFFKFIISVRSGKLRLLARGAKNPSATLGLCQTAPDTFR